MLIKARPTEGVYACFLNRKVWQSNYASQAETLAAIDTPLLQDLRKRAISNRDRKNKYIEEIKRN